ncbi:hypothetical protein GCM10011365_01970 [Marinicella pacifica]|uniref:MqsR (Motility quorum-sensing regulator) toxin of toxin-antitoxin system n=1 Tax=Marinicella pacifica TaxID=1171543 RepID=A0A917FJK0_9GAMM|nr:type II toxin-antitoxin system MqsR family toxin [Marinicella pacifica]GGF84625.1 hypothetical protein GCM10011365_01970 [Marinicella pacifica]
MPHYDLDKVREAAQRLDIEYRGLKVRLDIANLGYELKDVADCIEKLTASHFHKTINYEDGQIDDVYKCMYQKINEDEVFNDELYIKLSLHDDCLSISLGSFHL